MAVFSKDTSGRSLLGWCKALVVLFLGLAVAHLGISLFLLTDLGSDPFTVMVQGMARVAGVSVGTVHVILSTLLMVVMLLTTRGYVKPGTVICAFCGGPLIDLFSWGPSSPASPPWSCGCWGWCWGVSSWLWGCPWSSTARRVPAPTTWWP